MYNGIKDQHKQAGELNDRNETFIKELEKENKFLKEEKEAVNKNNLEKAESEDAAKKLYEECKQAFLKLDDARFTLNKVMGPGGSMQEAERKMYLNKNFQE